MSVPRMSRDYSKRQTDRIIALLTADQHSKQVEQLIECLQEVQSSQLRLDRFINQPLSRYNGRTPVHLAASKGLWQCLEVLLKHGGNPNAVSSLVDSSQTPLHVAAKEGNGKCVELLLENGADLWLETSRKETALSLTGNAYCRMVIENMTSRLRIPKRTKQEENLVKDLHEMVRSRKKQAFYQVYTNLPREKVDLGTRWNDLVKEPGSSETLLYGACASDADEIVEYMLSMSPNQPLPNLESGESPLHVASSKSNHKIATLLLKHSPRLVLEQRKLDNKSPLHNACLIGDRKMVEIILDHILMLVTGQQHKYSEDNPFSLDIRDSHGVTPFYLACLYGFPLVVKELLNFRSHPQYGDLISLDVNSVLKKSDHTPLHAAACSGSGEVVSILFSLVETKRAPKAHPSATTEDKLRSALQGGMVQASGSGIFETSSGALVTGHQGLMKGNKPLFLTPLAEACVHNNIEVIDVFLKHDIRDGDGLACRVALVVGNHEVAQKVLAYECTARKEKRAVEGEQDDEDSWSLRLGWAKKKLSEMRGEWVGPEARFYPTCEGEEFDDARAHRQGQRDSPTLSLHSQLPQQVDHSLIRVVSLKSNSLERVPIELFLLKNVNLIDLSENRLVSLPKGKVSGTDLRVWVELCGWECRALKELRLSHNTLTQLPTSVWVLSELERLIVTNNVLKTLLPDPDNNFSTLRLSKKLANIDFSSNHLSKIEAFVAELPLKTAYFNHNRLTYIPLALWQCQTLQELQVSHNNIRSLALSADDLANKAKSLVDGSVHMEAVRRSTHVTQPQARFRSQLSHNPPLNPEKSLDLDSTQHHLRAIDKVSSGEGDYIDVGSTQEYSKLAKLDLAFNEFETFPEELPCLAPSLTELIITHNPIREVEIRFLPPSLRKLKARECSIEKFGSILNGGQLSAVMDRCVYKDFRDQPCTHRLHQRLQNLSTLSLRHNRLTHFQVFYQQIPKAGIPNFGEQECMEYQSQVTVTDILYPSLENLDLSHNNLQGLFNPNIAHLTMLKAIELNDNEHLQKIPYELGLLKRRSDFTELNITHLPNLIQPPKSYQDSTLSKVLTFLAAGLKNSDVYRTIKLFLVGKGESGKTTLLRRLRSVSDQAVERTEGINIVDFTYTPTKSHLFFGKPSQKPIQFLAWDFAGQEAYHATHQCFYSRRSLYLAIFRLTDGEKGVKELDKWLRSIELRAHGSPVIIVGTHMDKVDRRRMQCLEDLAKKTFQGKRVYPQVAEVVSVCGIQSLLFANNGIEHLKKTIYNVATHLQLGKDGKTLVYKPEMKEDDPKALFMERVPKSFIDLQGAIQRRVEQCQEWREAHHEGMDVYQPDKREPVMNEEEFRGAFGHVFKDDKDELDEAVSFLNLQGTLLHFDDHGLKDLYFLDPQWLAKLMAHVIHPYAVEGDTPVVKGIVQIAHLFWNLGFPEALKLKYIQLLEKFEVALKISSSQVLIPSLMPDSVTYPTPNDDLHDVSLEIRDEFHQPALRRFWLADYIPDGFWPRLICRIATDRQIEQTLKMVIGEADSNTPQTSPQHEPEHGRENDMLQWRPWKTGVAFSHRGRTLLVVKEEDNKPSETNDDLEWLPAKKRIEIHVYAPEWLNVLQELVMAGRPTRMLENPISLPGIATQLLVKISQHLLSLAEGWFHGVLKNVLIYIPCWKCYGRMPTKLDVQKDNSARYFPVERSNEKFPVFSFNHEQCIIPAALEQDLVCPTHGPIKVVHTAPDLIFWDLASLSTYAQDMMATLDIKQHEVLGKGGYGFVCKGELISAQGKKKKVAVKGFLSSPDEAEHCTISELLEKSKEPQNLYHAYKEIRHEVSFLAMLDHPNLTKLCGVRTSPYMCLLLELAPRGSLRGILKQYKKYGSVLEPLTLQLSIAQIASGLEYLHATQIVHLDMKSPNVLVWQFPSGCTSRDYRIDQAGNVWLKLADYGISQVSTKQKFKVTTHMPEGTPGYIAPELFGVIGQEISSEKVDVFAFGMVVYELLSLQVPFEHVDAMMRNLQVKENRRPALRGGGIWTLVQAQDIMRLCWAQNPEERPTMNQLTQWVNTEEFGRLRAEIELEKVEKISCACVFRIRPEDEVEFAAANGHSGLEIDTIPEEPTFNGLDDDDSLMEFVRHSRMHDFQPPEMGGVKHHTSILPPVVEGGRLRSDSSADFGEIEDGSYRFLPQSKSKEERSQLLQQRLQPYTQVWVCDRKENGLLQIFTYYDSQAGYYVFAGYSSDEISVICPVRNMMWIGTAKGILKLKHAPTLSTKFKGDLSTEGKPSPYILSIVHVAKTSTVLVTTSTGDIWAFHDKLTPQGLKIEDHLVLSEDKTCYQLAVIEVGGSLEVWGTMDHSQLLLLEKKQQGWEMRTFEVASKPQWQFFHIAHATFEDKNRQTQNHLWVPYWMKSHIVCFDAQARQLKTTLDTSSLKLNDTSTANPKVTALITSGKKVVVGTDFGTVGIIDSETGTVLHCLQWHTEKVRTLLLMPTEMEPCICSEIPLPESEFSSFSQVHKSIVRQRQITVDPEFVSLVENPYSVPNSEPERTMVASIGSGRRRFIAEDTAGSDVRLLAWRC